MKLSLRRRILLTIVPFLLLLGGLGGAGAILMNQLGQRSDAILRENYDSVSAMAGLNTALERIDASFRFALAGLEKDAVSAYRDNWVLYREQLGIEDRNITIHPEEERLVAKLQALTAQYQKLGDNFYRRPAGDAKRRVAYFESNEGPGLLQVFQDIKRVSAAIHKLNEDQMKTASRSAQETARASVITLILGLVVAVLLAIASIWWLQSTILAPIRAVTEAAQTIGGGQLQLAVPVLGSDEIGQLAQAFNAMTQKLRAYRQTNTERLLRARQTSQATIDSFPDPIVVMDLQGRVEFANPAAQRVLGINSPGEGQVAIEWQPPEALRQPLADSLQQQRAYLTDSFDQSVAFHLDGEDRAYLPQIRPIRSPEGETLGAAVVLNDVTRFRLLDRLKSDWVATVSHELKTPLTSVRLAVHVLLEEIVGPLEPKQVELLVEARENTERLLKLIEHLLSLARLEDGHAQLQLAPTDPADLVRTAKDVAAARAEDKRVEIVIDDPANVPKVLADSARLGHALNNLLDNAITYTESGGKVTLSVANADKDQVRITVADTGIGIPPEYVPFIFDRFFRVPGREERPGTGLGLAIVREVVLAHEGTIECESTPGKGTAFQITLPAVKGAP